MFFEAREYGQDMETIQVPITMQVDKKFWYIHTMEYYSAVKKMKSYHLWQQGWM